MKKHTILYRLTLSILVTLFFSTQTEHTYHSKAHALFIPQKIIHVSQSDFSCYASISSSIERKYYSEPLTPAQQLNIINKWIEQYLRADTTSYSQLPPASQTTKISAPARSEKVEPTTQSTTIPFPQEIPYITDLENILHVQRLCLEWEKHSAILDARTKAIEQIKNGNTAITTQRYTTSHKMQNYCNAHDVDPDILTQSSGTAMQHTIHQEFVTITKKSSTIWHNQKSSKPLRKMTGIIADFTSAGIEYNNKNQSQQALNLANACWMILDCIQAAAEGLVDGAYHIIDDIIHPMRTAQAIAENTAICGYYIGKIAVEIGQLGYLVIAEPPQRMHEKLSTWKQNFALIYEAIQEKRLILKMRDIIKEGVSFGVQCYAAPKVLHGLGKLFKQAHRQVIAFTNDIPALKKTNALTTPEGIVVRIAENTAEYMKNNLADPVKHINTVKKFTQHEVSEIAKRLNFKKTNYFSHGQPIFKRGGLYISYDIDCHNGGIWKMANSIENLKSKRTRMGTYDINLNRIGD